MRNPASLALTFLALAGLTAASVWATTVPPRPLARKAPIAGKEELIAPYVARFGRNRPLIAIVGENHATELTDFVIPYGILKQADVADVKTVGTQSGPMHMRPALSLQPDSTIAAFDQRYPEGADYVIVPMVVKHTDRALTRWIAQQSAKGSTIVSICDGALVAASAGVLDGRRATAHWATLSYRRGHFPNVKWVENSRYVADGRVASSAGISASVPISLALVKAIAGDDRAAKVARDLEVKDYSTRHKSKVFAPAFGRNLTALATTFAINPAVRRDEAVGIPVSDGVDETALAITADAFSRTGRSKAYSIAVRNEQVLSRHGLKFLIDRPASKSSMIDRLVTVPDAPAGRQLDAALGAIERTYGRLTAFGVALEFEYPDFE